MSLVLNHVYDRMVNRHRQAPAPHRRRSGRNGGFSVGAMAEVADAEARTSEMKINFLVTRPNWPPDIGVTVANGTSPIVTHLRGAPSGSSRANHSL